MNSTHVRVLFDHIDAQFPERVPPVWSEGWPGESEAALLDAVFSARATYGGEHSGVRAVVGRWRAHRGESVLDDLEMLACRPDGPAALVPLLGKRQRVPGNYSTKAAAAALGARALVDAGCRHSTDIGPTHCAALMSVPGLGARTWELLSAALGILDEAAVARITSFVSDALDEPVDAASASHLLHAVAPALHITVRTLTHAIVRRSARPSARVPGESAA